MTDPDPLDDFFDAARDAPRRMPDSLLMRIAADAEREVSPPSKRSRHRMGVLALLGGWPALGGLATATLAGVWIGVANPLGVDPLGLVGAGDVASAELSVGYLDVDWALE
ncbi:MAG: hypothetical protein AAGK37_10095 [Pseudomonadota bacterium]